MKIHKEGRTIISIIFFLLILLNLISCFITSRAFPYPFVWFPSFIFFSVFLSFFRSPYRIFNGNTQHVIVAPADGRIVVIEKVIENDFFKEKRIQISIFMGIGNVHANWIPMNGKIIHYAHQNGRYRAAYLPKSSTENERSTVIIESETGEQILVRQIAGVIARRIVTYVRPLQECKINEPLGFIKFGSRVDIFLPENATILVKLNQRVYGNQSILAELSSIKNIYNKEK